MPAEFERAARIFQAEVRDGYRDRIVIGGLAGFVRHLQRSTPVPEVASVADLLRDYAALGPAERAARLDQASQLLARAAQPPDRVESARPSAARPPTEPAAAPPPAIQPATAAPPPPVIQTGAATPPPVVQPVAIPRFMPSQPPAGITLATPIAQLKGIGQARARLYHKLGLHAVRDLLFHFPIRHHTFPPPTPITEVFFQPMGSIVGTLERIEVEHLPRGLQKLKATIRDASGTATATWLRHGIARLGIQPGESIALSGKLVQQGRQLIFDDPEYERAAGPAVHTRGLVPVHPLTKGLTERELRFRIHWALAHFAHGLSEPLPETLRQQHDLLPIDAAVQQMHYPTSQADFEAARRRFAFEELLLIQLLVLRRRMSWQHDPAAPLVPRPEVLRALRESLPFDLTGAQRRVTQEILHDLAQTRPMTRLLQGEVGSGKTAVAALALLNAVADGFQAALMAPTEILAEQHFATLGQCFDAARPRLEQHLKRPLQVALLTGSVKGKERDRIYAAAASGELDVLVGTQALIQDKLAFSELGLIIVDEQHRFGVRQRVELRQRSSPDRRVPHLLVMTATPIPRSLALCLYGDLDLSTLDEMPPGRQFPKTVLLGSDERDLAYERVRRAAAAGQQAFVICPLVSESEALEAKAATEEFERLRTGELSSLKLGLLHGRMRPQDKDAVMRAFRDRQFDVLVSTAVVEVGVDVPNATVMLIEGAERFGLAQLHQFRGRVGRAGQRSVCILLTDVPDPNAHARLQAVVNTTNGLELAEQDLRLRGPGDFFGVRQSGFPELRVARLDDAAMVDAARGAAATVLQADPELLADEHAALKAHLVEFAARAAAPS